jgi:hypothetical protein
MYNAEYAYKVEQLTAMRDYERKQEPNQQYGAHLDHWIGHGKPINLDAGALNALINYYRCLDDVEHAQAVKQAEKADSDGQMTIAVNVGIKRYYHYYAEVPEDASDDTIHALTVKQIAYMPIDKLETYSDPDMDVEPDDIDVIDIDRDSIAALNW